VRTASPRAWRRLGETGSLEFVACSANGVRGWNGRGEGTVRVARPDSGCLVFDEGGVFQPETGRALRFRNVFRWTLTATGIRLEHLRHGVHRPVYLFTLIPEGVDRWRSDTPHRCAQDRYAAQLDVRENALDMLWTVVGPSKREELRYRYA
jgi:hypothetical protein